MGGEGYYADVVKSSMDHIGQHGPYRFLHLRVVCGGVRTPPMWGHDGGGRDDGYGAASGEVVGSTDLPSSPPIYCPPSLPTTALFLVLPSSTYTDRPGTDPPNSEVAALCSIGQCRRGGPPA